MGSGSSLDFLMYSDFIFLITSFGGVNFLILAALSKKSSVSLPTVLLNKLSALSLLSINFFASLVRLFLLIKFAFVTPFLCSIGPDCSTLKTNSDLSFKISSSNKKL